MAKNKTKQYRDMLRRFNMEYGTSGTTLEGWQRLCDDCGVGIGTSITQCKKAWLFGPGVGSTQSANRSKFIVAAHINIVDLVQAKSRGQCPVHHSSRRALAVYTLEENKVFPKHVAHDNGFLKALLVQVL